MGDTPLYELLRDGLELGEVALIEGIYFTIRWYAHILMGAIVLVVI